MSKRSSSFSAADNSGGPKGVMQCRVKLLDSSDFVLELNKKADGKFVFDQVLRRLGVSEKEHFGLEYEDDQKLPQWLDLTKPIKKQLKKSPYRLVFRVRRYPLDPMMTHSSCRTMFYQQLKNDLVEGKLKCPEQLAPSIISYILQADLGDFESTDKDVEFMSDERLPMNDSKQMQEEIIYFHQIYKGMNPQQAVKGFLRKVRDLETYASTLFDVRFEDDNRQLGISPNGVAVYRKDKRVLVREWPAVLQLSFKSKKFVVEVQQDMHGPDLQLIFELESVKMAKDIWRQCAEYAKYYSEPQRRLREDPETIRSPGAMSVDKQSGHTFEFTQSQAQPNAVPESAPNLPENVQKAKSLPRRLPGEDPIAAALMLHKGQKGQISGLSSPTSPASTSLSEEAVSPKSDIEPEIPVFQDDVQHNHHHYRSPFSGEKQTPPVPHHQHNHGRQPQHFNEHMYPSHHQQQNVISPSQDGAQMYSGSTPQLSNGVRNRSTDVPEELSQEPGDDMDDSLLDLAAELGDDDEGSRTELKGSGRIQEVGVAHDMSSASERSKSSPHSPHPHHYHSSTLPSSFTNGHDNEEELPPPKPPRNDTQPTRSSPYYPRLSHTSGREHKRKKRHGQQHVQNWVQDQQQHREYYSSSQESGSGHGSHDSPVVSHAHHHHFQPSPEMRPSTKHRDPNLTSEHMEPRERERERGRQYLSHENQSRSHGHHYRSRDQHVSPGGRTETEHKVHGYPLPSSPAPPPYVSPSPDSHQAHLLQQLGRPSQRAQDQNQDQLRERNMVTGLNQERETGMSNQNIGQSGSHSMNRQEDGRHHQESLNASINSTARTYSTTSEELDQAIEELTEFAVATETTLHGKRPSSGNRREVPPESLPHREDLTSNEVDMRVERAMLARNERRDLEKNLRQSQKAINQRFETTSKDTDSIQPVSHATGRVKEAAAMEMKNLDPADFAKEPMAVDPRNFMKADSPVYDRLENVFSDSGTGGERGQSSRTSSSTPLSVGLTGSRGSVPEIVTTQSPLESNSSEQPRFNSPSLDLGDILQEVMETNNLPPPPRHLVALSQELEGNSQKSTEDLLAQKQYESSSHNAVQNSTSSSARKETQFDPKLFLKHGSIVPKGDTLKAKGGDDHMRSLSACDTSRLPPEIASFMTRVRPNARPADSKFNTQQEPIFEAGDEVRRPHSAETPGARSPRVSVSPTYNLPTVNRIEVSEGIVRHQPSPDVEKVTVMPDTASSKSLSQEQAEMMEPMASLPPPVMSSSITGQNMSSHYAMYDTPRSVMNEMERQAANERSGSVQQPKKAASFSESSNTASKYSYQRYRQEASQKKQQQQQQQSGGFPNKSLSLPRGQQPPTGEISQYPGGRGDIHVGPCSPTRTSAPTTPLAQGDSSYMYPQPQGMGMGRSGSLDNTSNAFHRSQYPQMGNAMPPPAQSRANPPRSQSHKTQRQQQQHQYYGQDVRRAQTFNSGQGSSRPTQGARYHHDRSPTSPMSDPEGEDSLPNSPTYFTRNPPNQDRDTPSPNTQALNQSFQEHLDSLNGPQKQGRKMRVLDWMQRTDPHQPMIRDPGTHVPSQPYQKQPHVYATANDPRQQQERDQLSSRASQQTGYRHDYGASGRRHTGMMQQGYGGRQQAQQQQQSSRDRLHTFPYANSNPQAHRQPQQAQGDRGYKYYPPTTHTGPPRGGQTSTLTATAPGGGGVKSQGSYPTAKFGKDFYVIDV